MSDTIQPVIMDSRRFLSSLNDSVQAKVGFIESKISQMGKSIGKNWKLAALRNTNLYIEECDQDHNQFYQADYKRLKGGKIVVENIKPVHIVEGEKSKLFLESCYDLVNAIESNDQKGMANAFSRMASQRFSSRAIPVSGKVRTRDGVVRTINVQTDIKFDESTKATLVDLIVESLKDQVTIKDGLVVEGRFTDGTPLRLPVTKWSKHKVVARTMREAAQNAYWSRGFQNRVYQIAQLLHEDKVDDAVKAIAPFLKEYEEFTLLTREQVKTLVENALATNGIFNQQLCDNTALLMYRTNLKVNKDTILTEWRRIAKASQHPTLLENTNILARAKNFEVAADRFLQLVFEAMSNRDVTAEALATTLEVLKERTPKIKESSELSSKLDDLINRLKGKEFDDNSIYEAEDFIATVQEELTMGEDLQNFDEVPGGNELPAEPDPAGQELGSELGGAANGQGQPGVVFNAPLIQIGADAASSLGLGGEEEEAPEEDLSGLMGGADEAAGGEEDALMGGGADAMAGGAPPPMGGMESLSKDKKPISEDWDEEKYGEKPWKKKKDKKDDNDVETECNEDTDPYAFQAIKVDHSVGADYGAPAISDSADVTRVINAMTKLAESNNLTGHKLQENLEDLALAGFEATGMRIPPRKLSNAIDQVIAIFTENITGTSAIAMAPGLREAPTLEDDDVLGVDDDPVEDQHKWGTTRRKGGYKRSSIDQRERSTKNESKITWHHAQEDAILGEMAGVKFVFDHGGNSNLKPVILSEDGASEVPVPAELYESAFAAAKMAKGNPVPFIEWLHEGLEQLRPESPEETNELDVIGGDPSLGDEEEMMGAADPMGGDPSMGTDPMGGMDAEMGGMDAEMSPVGDELGGAPDPAAMAGEVTDDLLGGEEGGDPMGGSTVTITTNPQGGVKIDVKSQDVQVNQAEMGLDAGLGDEIEPGLDDETNDMQPVDSVNPGESPDDMNDSLGDSGTGEEDDGEEGFPNFDEPTDEEPVEEPGFGEDEDITSPKSTKYTKLVKGDKRQEPDVKLPGKSGNELEGFGTKAKKGSKSGEGVQPAKLAECD